jgi:hypothetical protein
MSENRDDSTGQFTPNTDGLFGTEYKKAKAGFTTKKDEPAATPDYSDADPLREADANRTASQVPQLELSVTELRGEIDTKEAVTVEQAAAEYSNARSDLLKFADGLDLTNLAEEVDKKRAEVIKGDPKGAESLGVEIPKEDAKPKGEVASLGTDEGADPIDTMDGLDPETRKALKIPQVRQALEQEFTRAEQATQAYSAGLSNANAFSHAAILTLAPELASIPLAQWREGINVLAQADPARGKQLADMLGYANTIQSAQQQEQQRQAQAQHQQFQTMRQQYICGCGRHLRTYSGGGTQHAACANTR